MIERFCGYCHAPATKTCGGCSSSVEAKIKAYYCCVEHQTLMYKYHRHMCGENNSIELYSPDFQPKEGPLLVRLAEDALRMGDKAGQAKVKLRAKSVVEEFNHGLRLNSISKRDPKAVAARSYKIDNARLGILGLVSSEAKQTLSRVTGLPPYYYHVGACSSVAESSSSYYHPWFQEFFTYNCLQDIIDQQKGATDANQYLMESIGRLEVISLKAKEEGFDKSEIYAMITNTTRLQSEWSYGKAIGVDKKNDLVLGLIDALADTGCSISSNGVIDTSNRFKNY